MEQVSVNGKIRYMLSMDIDCLIHSKTNDRQILLLGAHDPYLELKDRPTILPDPALHKIVWKTVGNPGAVLKDGRIVGIWKAKTIKDKLDIIITLFEEIQQSEKQTMSDRAEEYTLFRKLNLRKVIIES